MPDNDDELTSEQIGDLLSFDPFAATPEQEAAPSEGTPPLVEGQPPQVDGSDESDAAGQAAGDGVAPPAPAATPPPPPAEELQSLRQELEQLRNQNRELQQLYTRTQAQQAPPPPQQTAQQPPAGDDLPEYLFDVPEVLVEALRGEDVGRSRQALAAIIQGIGKNVHRQIREEMTGRFRIFGEAMVNTWSQRQQQEQQRASIKNDFYGTFPQLNRPELVPLVNSVTQAVMTESGMTEWSPVLRDLIGNRMLQILNWQSAAPQAPAPASSVRRTATAPPPPMMGNGSRPPVAPGVPSDIQDIWETINSR